MSKPYLTKLVCISSLTYVRRGSSAGLARPHLIHIIKAETRVRGRNTDRQRIREVIDELLRAIIREELAPLLKANGARSSEDRLLSASQAAEVLQVSERWPPRSNRKRSPLVGPAIEKDKRSCSKDLAKYFSTSKTVPLDVIPRAQSTTCIKQEDGGNYRWGKLSKSAFSLTK